MYEQPGAASLSQGDIVDECPILVWKLQPPPLDLDVPPEVRIIRVVVLTQACDLAQQKTTRVVVAPVYEAAELIARNILKPGAASWSPRTTTSPRTTPTRGSSSRRRRPASIASPRHRSSSVAAGRTASPSAP